MALVTLPSQCPSWSSESDSLDRENKGSEDLAAGHTLGKVRLLVYVVKHYAKSSLTGTTVFLSVRGLDNSIVNGRLSLTYYEVNGCILRPARHSECPIVGKPQIPSPPLSPRTVAKQDHDDNPLHPDGRPL